MSKKVASSKSGFTMVELSIAMAFIAMLLIAITIITTSLVAIYQKGLSIKSVNGVGRNLIDEFTRAINAAPSVDTTSICNSLAAGDIGGCVGDSANKFIFQEQRSALDANGNSEQYNGIFCTGQYSYIWNTKAGIESGRTVSLLYRADDGIHTLPENPSDPPIRLARINDRTYRLCSAVMDSDYKSNYATTSMIDITNLAGSGGENKIKAPVSDFLRMFDTDLQLGNLTIFPISQDAVTLRSFISGTFILTTIRGETAILNTGDYCDPNGYRSINPDGTIDSSSNQNSLGSEFNYCAINKFNFAARTAGSGV